MMELGLPRGTFPVQSPNFLPPHVSVSGRFVSLHRMMSSPFIFLVAEPGCCNRPCEGLTSLAYIYICLLPTKQGLSEQWRVN